MRSVRITGVVGTSAWVPLDTYSPALASVTSSVAALGVEYTMDNVFDLSITPVPVADALVGGILTLPAGTRAVRGLAMAAPDIMVVSQQGLS